MTRYHLIGIGGSGLSAIARILLERGDEVSGSDHQRSPQVQELEEAGARISLDHRPEYVTGADIVLRSSAIPDDNVEIQAALELGIPVLKRVDFLDRLVGDKEVIAIAGTHGKTTTTAMIAWTLNALGWDPSYVIGGVAADLERNAHVGSGKYFVIEADEYDHMFLGLHPALAVVTSVEHDHPDCYPTPEAFQSAFQSFVSQIEGDGFLVACGDDPGGAELLDWAKKMGRPVYTYGIGEHNYDYWARGLQPLPRSGFIFDVYKRDRGWVADVWLQVPGEHNVHNALATMIVADILELNLQEAAKALGDFSGVGRRFEVRGEAAGVTVIDDYAHHPTEIRATLAAAHACYPNCTIWAVWQPHTYSRTRLMLPEFVSAFEDAAHVLITEIYAAREPAPEDGFSANQVAQSLAAAGEEAGIQVRYTPQMSQAQKYLVQETHAGDVVLVLSAGDGIKISEGLLEALRSRRETAA